MIPEEKAKWILNSLKEHGLTHEQAKKCAIIAVDEIIGCTDWPYTLFYEDVKQEIERND
jgi:hypothetical protein